MSTVKDGFLFDFHYLNSLPLERGPFPSINNWHLITYLPHRCRLWSEPCSFISTLLRIDRRADRSTIKGIPRGAVNTRSPHTPTMWSSAGLSHSCCSHPSTSCWTHPAPPIWVKYSQRITNLLQWHHLRGCDCRRAYWWGWWWGRGSTKRICKASCSDWTLQQKMISFIKLITVPCRCLSSAEQQTKADRM